MGRRLSVPLRLASLPVLASAVVVTLASTSMYELSHAPEGDHPVGQSGAAVSGSEPREPLSVGIPQLTTEEAIRSLRDSPGAAAIEALWPRERFQGKLYTLLFLKKTPPHLRIDLLSKFASRDPKLALDAARALAREEGLEDVQLLSAAFEVLSKHGDGADLELLSDRPHQPVQLEAARRRYRADLSARVVQGEGAGTD